MFFYLQGSTLKSTCKNSGSFEGKKNSFPSCTKPFNQDLKAFEARPRGALRPGLKGLDVKGRRQECSPDFSLKSNMAKTARNFACQFVYACRKLPCTYFPPFLLRISEIMYAKTLACHGRPLLELLCYTKKENSLLFFNTATISVVFLLIFFSNDHLNP